MAQDDNQDIKPEGSDVALRIRSFMEERDQEASRRYAAVTYVAMRMAVVGIPSMIAGRACMWLGIKEAFAIYAFGMCLVTLSFGLFSTCPIAKVDIDDGPPPADMWRDWSAEVRRRVV